LTFVFVCSIPEVIVIRNGGMSAGEEQPTGEESIRRRLGLERLSPIEIWLLGQFVTDVATGVREQYEQELRETLVDMRDGDRRTTIEQLATSDIAECRGTACSVIAHYAEQQPKLAFPLWRTLMRDEDSYVRECAADALAEALGVLDLDPTEVVKVVDAYYEGKPGGRAILPAEDAP
jgi:hypothetical protein